MLFRKYWAGWTALALTAVMFFAAGALAQDAQSAPPALALAEGGATAADLDSRSRRCMNRSARRWWALRLR